MRLSFTRHCEERQRRGNPVSRKLLWIACLTLAMTLVMNAQASANTGFGLAMHGAPKYGPEDTHLSYVNPQAAKGGHLKEQAIGTFDTLNPFSIKGKAAKGLNLVYDRLMARRWDEPFTMYPLIAERYEMPDDRSSITFHLNPKARFHDRSPILARDVLFSYETLKEHGRPNMRRIYALAQNVEILSERSIRFSFGEGYDRETALIFSIMPVLSESYWKELTFDSTTLSIPNLNGPYRISSVDAGRSITYKRVEDYWASDLLANIGHYNFETITFDYYRDDNVALQAFKAGESTIRRERSVAKWSQGYSDIDPARITLYEAPHQRAARAYAFIFNMRRAPFDNPDVREALSIAFHHEWVEENIYFGQYQRIQSYFPNSRLAARRTHVMPQPLRQRLRAASSRLDEAGFPVINGKRDLTFEILLGSPDQEKIALSYKKSLERLGVTLNIRVMDSASFQDRLNVYDYDMVSYFWQNSLSPGTEQMLYWSCEAADQPSRWNFAGICYEELDALAGSIANAQSYKELTDKAQAIDSILLNHHIGIPLFYSAADYIAHDAAIQKPTTTPLYGAVLETWWMDQE